MFLGWSPREVEFQWPFQFELGRHRFAFAHACFSFFIEELGFGCGTATFGDTFDDEGGVGRAAVVGERPIAVRRLMLVSN